MELAVDSRQRAPRLVRARPWVAVVIAAIIFALIPLVGLQLFLALPLIGLVLTAGTPPDYVAAYFCAIPSGATCYRIDCSS